MSVRLKPIVTGSSSEALDAALTQGNLVPSPPLWQVKDLADFPKEEKEPSLPPSTPPEARGELITGYVCTVIPHEPLCLRRSQAEC